MKWPKRSPNGSMWWKAQSPTYYTQKPGWVVAEKTEAQSRWTDWVFLTRYLHTKIPTWARPDYHSPMRKYWK